MIAAVSIGKGPIFAWGYIRGNEGGLIFNKESVEWPNKWKKAAAILLDSN